MKRLCLVATFVGLLLALAVAGAGAAQVLISENFDSIANGKLPTGWTPYDGTWEVQNGKLIGNSPDSATLSRIVFGDPSWKNYEISATMTYTWAKDAKRWASIMHRVQPNGGPPYAQIAIRQGTTATNGVEVAYRNTKPAWDVWKTTPYKEDFALGKTHNVRVVVFGSDVWAFIDGEAVIDMKDAVKEPNGQVGLHVCGLTVEFDNVVVKSIDEKDIAAMGLK